jgi:hypothetical protein
VKRLALLSVFLALPAFSCAHVTPVLKACGPELLADVGTALVCDLADTAALPACVVSALAAIDKDCDVTALLNDIITKGQQTVIATGDSVEAVKVARAKAWLASKK